MQLQKCLYHVTLRFQIYKTKVVYTGSIPQMYKSICGIIPVSFQFFFVLNKNIHNYTRYSNNVHINLCATQVRAYSIRNYGPKMWIEIPSKIRDSASFYMFKKKIKLYHLNSYIGC